MQRFRGDGDSAQLMLCIPTLKPRPLDDYDQLCERYRYGCPAKRAEAEAELLASARRTGMDPRVELDTAWSAGETVHKYQTWM